MSAVKKSSLLSAAPLQWRMRIQPGSCTTAPLLSVQWYWNSQHRLIILNPPI